MSLINVKVNLICSLWIQSCESSDLDDLRNLLLFILITKTISNDRILVKRTNKILRVFHVYECVCGGVIDKGIKFELNVHSWLSSLKS